MTYLAFIFALPLLLGVPPVAPTPLSGEPVLLATLDPSLAQEPPLSNETVPFYSQFADISSPKWQKVGCGIASLAMVIEYYNPNVVSSVDALLEQGIDKHAYSDAGWTYKGLIAVAQSYGIAGESYDLGGLSRTDALARFSEAVRKGPVIASVHYTLDPTNPIPHLIVVHNIEDGVVYYNDPADPTGNSTISEAAFAQAWKQRYIALYPDVRMAAN